MLHNSRLIHLLNTSSDLFFIYNFHNLKFIYFNKVVERILGKSEHEIFSLTFEDLKQLIVFNDNELKDITLKDDERGHVSIQIKSGYSPRKILSFQLDYEVKSNDKGHLLAYCQGKEVTSEPNPDYLKKELSSLRARYQTIFETVDEGIFLILPDGRIAEANQLGLHLHGYDNLCELNDMVEKYKSNVELHDFHGNTLPMDQWPSIRSLNGETVINYEGILHRIDSNEDLFVSINSKPVYGPDEELLAVVHSIRDITRKKTSEIEHEKQFYEIQSNHQILENLLYIAAHDLKGPINNFKLLYGIAESSTDDEKLNLFPRFESISSQLEKTITGLTEILEIQNIDQDYIRKINLKQLISNLNEELNENLIATNGTITCDLEAEEITYVETFLVSILKNLLTNAIKYSKEGIPLKIKIESKREGSYLMILVEDNGIGIDLERYEKNLFKPFKRFTRQGEGTGVGLFLIRNMISRNGGYIKVDSIPGEGTKFYCYLKEYSKKLKKVQQ